MSMIIKNGLVNLRKALYADDVQNQLLEAQMDLMTVQEAATATKMSASWWRQRIFRKQIKYVKLGRAVRIPASVIEEILNRALVEPRETPKCR
jgi:excisionase family DNA binding protein